MQSPIWTVALGPGPQAVVLTPLLQALGQVPAPGVVPANRPEITPWDDLGELLGQLNQRGKLILDAERLPREDLGLVRRFLEREPGWEILLLAEEAPRPYLASLLAHARVQSAYWPLPVDQLGSLLQAPACAPLQAPVSQEREAVPEPEYPEASVWEDDLEEDPFDSDSLVAEIALSAPDLERIEAILKGTDPLSLPEPDLDLEPESSFAFESEGLHPAEFMDPMALEPKLSEYSDYIPQAGQTPAEQSSTSTLESAMSVGLSREELDAFSAPMAMEPEALADPEPELRLDPEPHTQPLVAPEPERLPVWYRPQVADLADLAQRLQLDSLAMREAGGPAAGADDAWLALEQDVLRLGQFARTLGFVAAPPPPGDQAVDLAGFTQELLSGSLGDVHAGHRPRVLFRATERLHVLADKSLLGAALDALVQLAAHCVSEHDRVAVEADHEAATGSIKVRVEAAGERALLDLEFPAGPLHPSHAIDQACLRPELLEPYAVRRIFPDYGANALAAAAGILAGHGGGLQAYDRPDGKLALVVDLPRMP
ncbi:MAG: hypothetical protein ACI8QC_001654 [Planctomycetota bacterium]|jgi:hypothetical protein